MLSLSQLTPVAYITDGTIVCIKCGDARKLLIKDQLIEYTLDSEFSDENGCYCDDCGKELVEPYTETEYCAEHGEVEVNPSDARCPTCQQATSTAMEEAKRFAEQDEE